MKGLTKTDFEKLFRVHYASLCRYGLSLVGDMDQAEDITQQVFVKLWNSRVDLDPSRSLKSYLYTSVRNACLNYIRDNRKFRSRFLDQEIMAETEFKNPTQMMDMLEVKELSERIKQAIETIPGRSRQIFLMNRKEDKSYREIAESLEISIKTVEAHMSAALKILRTELKDYLWLVLLFYRWL